MFDLSYKGDFQNLGHECYKKMVQIKRTIVGRHKKLSQKSNPCFKKTVKM